MNTHKRRDLLLNAIEVGFTISIKTPTSAEMFTVTRITPYNLYNNNVKDRRMTWLQLAEIMGRKGNVVTIFNETGQQVQLQPNHL